MLLAGSASVLFRAFYFFASGIEPYIICPVLLCRNTRNSHLFVFFAFNVFLVAFRSALFPRFFFFFAEFTGSHTQFYDKFTFRSLTAQLLEHLWTLKPYRESIIRYSEDSTKYVCWLIGFGGLVV